MSVLSKPEIIKHYKAGNIVIEPFNKDNVGNASYDVRLGKYYFRQEILEHTQTLNPFHKKSVDKMYSELKEAIEIREIRSKRNPFHGLKPSDKVILIAPAETILAHTIEFIGGKNGTDELPAVTTAMRARSSLGRIGISVCKDAGWGDIGYINRWTMEITNFSSTIIPLPVGLRVAQIIFHETQPIDNKDLYSKGGKYQTQKSLKANMKNWKPENMLPKLYFDQDLGKYASFDK